MFIQNPRLAEIVAADPRYAYGAYTFLLEALEYTTRRHARAADADGTRHVSGRELCEGVRQFARLEYGLLAATVLRTLGIRKTGDVGSLVFNLIDAGVLAKQDSDSPADFEDVFDLEAGLRDGYPLLGPDAQTA